MKRHIVWALLTLIGLLGFSSITIAEEGKWTKKADMPIAMTARSASTVKGKIYVFGNQGTFEYDLGLADEEGQGVEAKGKLVTAWGKMKK